MNNLALVHIELGEYNVALDYINKALDLRTEYNLNPVDILHSYKSLSELYFIWNMQDKGNLYLSKTRRMAIKKFFIKLSTSCNSNLLNLPKWKFM